MFCKQLQGEMQNMKNVFIEGIQGMGKTTLLNSISAAVPEFYVCREGDYSPIDLAWCSWMSKEEYEAVLKCYRPIQNEIRKNTVQEQEHFIVTYTKIVTYIPNFYKELEKYEVYNGRKTLQDLKKLILSRYRNFSKNGYLFECSFFQNIIEDLILFHLLSFIVIYIVKSIKKNFCCCIYIVTNLKIISKL